MDWIKKGKSFIRVLFFSIVISCFTPCASMGIAYAASSVSDVEAARKDDLLDVAATLKDENKTNVTEIADKIEAADLDDINTIEEAAAYIRECLNSVYEYDPTDPYQSKGIDHSALEATWIASFRDKADAYGITENDSAQNSIDDAATKVNILTWNNDKDRDGNTMAQANQGAILEFLNSFETFNNFTTPLNAIAIALTIAFGCSSLLTMATDRNLSGDALTREFIKILAGVWVIYNYKFFMLLIIRFGTALVEMVLTTDLGADESVTRICLYESLTECLQMYGDDAFKLSKIFTVGFGNVVSGVVGSASKTMNAITSFVGGGLVELASSLTVYAVLIEIGVRYILTPIAIADLYSEKFRSSGWNWIKKLFACCIQGLVIYMIIFATDVLKGAIGAWWDPVTNTAINLTMLGMFAGSRRIANDIIGTH